MNRGGSLSIRSNDSEPLDLAAITVGDHAVEHPELKPTILGIIDAYRMGAALEAHKLYRSSGRGTSGELETPGRT
jgi:hypothetical protein